MSYLHSIGAVMVADDIMRRKRVLSKLQQELFDLMLKAIDDDPVCYTGCEVDSEELERFIADLKKDIGKMNAIELRKNIKIWKEDISFGRRK